MGADDRRGRLTVRTSRGQLSALARAAVVVSVLGAELAPSVGETAGFAGGAAESVGMKASQSGRKQTNKRNFCKQRSQV